MVVALHDRKRKRRARLSDVAASLKRPPRGVLIEDEGKSPVEPANSDKRRYRSLDIGWARTCRDQAEGQTLAMARMASVLFVAAVSMIASPIPQPRGGMHNARSISAGSAARSTRGSAITQGLLQRYPASSGYDIAPKCGFKGADWEALENRRCRPPER
jgi:hypothetical protein